MSGIKTHSSIQNMFISSHEIEHSFSNKAQRLVYQLLRQSVADSSLVHSPSSQRPHFFTSLTIVKLHIFNATYIFAITAHICTTMMQLDQDKFLPPFVKLSTSPYCTNISSQYDGTSINIVPGQLKLRLFLDTLENWLISPFSFTTLTIFHRWELLYSPNNWGLP
jgi:hypothetical protein